VRRLERQSAFPEPSAFPEGSAMVQDRWESLLGKTPRLRPWLLQVLQRRRTLLAEQLGNDARIEIDRILWHDLGRWLHDFESLPNYTVSAIALDLAEEPPRRTPERPPPQEPAAALQERAESTSPESAACEFEALVADPAFALAFHCIEVRVRPRLAAAIEDRPLLARVPESAWFGLLHASVAAEPRLTARVAIALVLRLVSPGWARVPAATRKAALRLFHAGPLDVRSGADGLRCALPADWDLSAAAAQDFVAAAFQIRKGLAEACALCARLVCRIGVTCRRTGKPKPGGLGLLQEDATGPATEAETREVGETARKFAQIGGFGSLVEILAEAP
jgi:hypothetical protein